VTGLFLSGVPEPRTRTLRLTKAAIVIMEDLATFTTNIDGGVKGTFAFIAISTKGFSSLLKNLSQLQL